MTRSPRPQGRLLGRDLELALVLAGVSIGLAATAAYLAGRALAPEAAQTMAFATIALAELLFVFSTRSSDAPAWRGPRNPLLVVSVVLSATLVALVVYVTPVQAAFGTVQLGALDLGLVLGLAVLPAALVELAKILRRRRAR